MTLLLLTISLLFRLLMILLLQLKLQLQLIILFLLLQLLLVRYPNFVTCINHRKSLLERVWLFPGVGETYLDPCLTTPEHAQISRSCKSLSKVVENARTCTFFSYTAIERYISNFGNSKVFPRLQIISLRNVEGGDSLKTWVLESSRYPKLQSIDCHNCLRIQLLIPQKTNLKSISDTVSNSIYSNAIRICGPQSFQTYEGTYCGSMHLLLEQTSCLQHLEIQDWKQLKHDAPNYIPVQIYNSLESLKINGVRSANTESIPTFTFPYPTSTMFVVFFCCFFFRYITFFSKKFKPKKGVLICLFSLGSLFNILKCMV